MLYRHSINFGSSAKDVNASEHGLNCSDFSTEKLAVAKAYFDQLERSNELSASDISSIRTAIAKAEASKGKDLGKLKGYAATVEKSAGSAKDTADAARLKGLAEILNQPAI